MLIINADDLGRTAAATNNSISCYKEGQISSASVMVFMLDSRRAAESAIAVGIETGLHLNLDLPFDCPATSPRLLEHQLRIIKHFSRGKWSQIAYVPYLRKDFDYVFKVQYEEYCRLFGKEPAQIDGHHHRHLCMNMLIDHIVPFGMGIRRNFTFEPVEKGIINRTYRRLVDRWLVRRYYCTDAFYSIEPIGDDSRLAKIVSRSQNSVVELMTHPAIAEHYEYLMSAKFRDLIVAVPKGNYRMLFPISKH
jgi:predicted glycoside hydrolase/deacetylase ChbG (UPF0249 family)